MVDLATRNFMSVDFPDPARPDTQKIPAPVRSQLETSEELKIHGKVRSYASGISSYRTGRA